MNKYRHLTLALSLASLLAVPALAETTPPAKPAVTSPAPVKKTHTVKHTHKKPVAAPTKK